MNKKILKGALAGTAVVALAAGGGTWASWNDFGNVNDNSVGAGILKLNLSNKDGSATTPLAFGKLSPGGQSQQAIYVASSDGDSVPNADLYLTLSNLEDQENGCSTNASEQAVDDCATNPTGELSKVLDMRIVSYAAPSALECKGWVGGSGDPGPVINNTVIPNNLGNMSQAPVGQGTDGTRVLISDAAHPLQPGQGVCLTFTSWWPKDHVGGTDDNAAQGDSMTFDSRFDLVQH
jgi:alternate signal-mediated exported protein